MYLEGKCTLIDTQQSHVANAINVGPINVAHKKTHKNTMTTSIQGALGRWFAALSWCGACRWVWLLCPGVKRACAGVVWLPCLHGGGRPCAQPCPGLRGFCWCGWRGLCVGAFAVLGEEIIMEKWGGRRGNNYGKVPAYERMKSEWFICIFMYFYILCVFVCIFVYLFFFNESNFCYLWCVLYFNCKC